MPVEEGLPLNRTAKRAVFVFIVPLLVLLAVPWAWAGPTGVPKKVQITDPVGDANYANSHFYGGYYELPIFGDVVTPVDASAAGDILKVWFTNNSRTISVHFLTEAPPPDSLRILYFVRSNWTDNVNGQTPCLLFYAGIEGNNEDGARVEDICTGYGTVNAKFTLEELIDGTGLLTITAPRAASASLTRTDAKVVAPIASTHSSLTDLSVNVFQIDNTQKGSDYALKG